MSLLSNAQKNNKKGSATAKNTASANSKTSVKAGKTASFSKKPIKTGGTRGS